MTGRSKATESEVILGEISGKMSVLITKMDDVTLVLRALEKHSAESKELGLCISREIGNIAEILSASERAIGNTIQPAWMSEINEASLVKEAYRKRKEIQQLWKKSLNNRKQLYWNAYKCEKYSEIYSQWIEKESPILPQKYLIKEITGEPEEETKLRWDLAMNKFRTDIAIIKNKHSRFKSRYEEIDQQINNQISKIATENVSEKIKEIWVCDISKEEEKSRQLWLNKEKFLVEYAKNYGTETTTTNNKRRMHFRKKNKRQQNKVESRSVPSKSTLNTNYEYRRQNPAKPHHRQQQQQQQQRSSSKRDTRSSNNSKNNRRLYSDVVRTQPNNNFRNNNIQKQKTGTNSPPQNRTTGGIINKQFNNQNKKQRRIHFLESGQQTPERDQKLETTIPKEIID